MPTIKIITLAFLLFCISPFLRAQSNADRAAVRQTVTSYGQMNMSSAQLESVVDEILEYRKRRRRRAASAAANSYAYSSGDGSTEQLRVALNERELSSRVKNIENLLLGVNERLLLLQSLDAVGKAGTGNGGSLTNTDREVLRTEIRAGITEIKGLLDNANQAAVVAPPIAIDNASDQAALQQYLNLYATRIADLQQKLTALEERLPQLADKTDYAALQRQLNNIEQRQTTDSTVEKEVTTLPQDYSATNRQRTDTTVIVNNSLSTADFDRQFAQLRAMMEELKALQSSSTAANNSNSNSAANSLDDSAYQELQRIVADRQRQTLLYAKDVDELLVTQKTQLNELAQLLAQYGNLDVMVSGFASETGAALYNQNLSERRAENVKRYLMQRGIHPSRIFMEYHGIDYTVDNLAQGRRVDVVLLINRG